MPESNGAAALYDIGGDCRTAVCGKKPQITTRFATSDDVIEFFGGPVESTMRALVAVMDDRVVGILGISRDGPVGKYFCDFSPDLKPYLKSMPIMRAIKQSLTLCNEYKGPVVSVAEHAEGCRILNRLGFIHLQGAIYQWPK